MKVEYKLKKILLFLSVYLLFPLSTCSLEKSNKHIPAVMRGILDATDWNFEKNGSLYLNGEWEFYWNQLLYPGDFIHEPDIHNKSNKKPVLTGYIKVPAIWNFNKINKTKLTFNGYATYRLKILLNEKINENTGVSIPRIHTSYNLYVNKEKLFSLGKVGKTKQDSHPDFCPHVISIHSKGTSLDIIIQVASFHYPVGGIDYPIQFGLLNELTRKRENKLVFDIIIFGCIFIIGIYNLFFYLFNKSKNYLLFFSILCFIMSFRALFTINVFFFRNIVNINWELLRRIDYFTIVLSPVFLYSYLISLFPDIFCKKILFFAIGVLIVSLVVLLFTPILITVIYAKVCAVTIIFYVIYNFVVIIRACLKKQIGAYFLLIGMIALGITAINDIFYDYRFLKTLLLTHLGVLLFVIIQSIYIFQHISKNIQPEKHLNKNYNRGSTNVEQHLNKNYNRGSTNVEQHLNKNYNRGSTNVEQRLRKDNQEKKMQIINSFDLTNREKEIVSLILEGNATKDIAVKLDIAVKTVENHLFNIYQKTGLHSRFEILSKMYN